MITYVFKRILRHLFAMTLALNGYIYGKKIWNEEAIK